MSVDAETIINRLASRIAQLEVDLAVALAQTPTPEYGTEIVGEGIRMMEVIDGDNDGTV